MRGRVVAVEGPSAAGKTRAVGAVARHLGGAPLAEAYERVSPRPALEWSGPTGLLRLERLLLTEDARRFREARDLAEAEGTVVVDTGFLGTLTYTGGLVRQGAAPRSVLHELVRTARELAHRGEWGLPDGILYLQTPVAERTRRARRDPVGHPSATQPRHQQVAAEESRFYRSVLAPAYGPRFRRVSGTGAAANVVIRLTRAAEAIIAPGHGAPAYGPILRAVERFGSVP
jgi:thymidylate kinase